MLSKNYRQTLELLLVFSLFCLSNVLAFAYAFWLVPVLVLLVSVVWLLLTGLSIWITNKSGLLGELLAGLKSLWTILPFLIFSGFSVLWSVVPDISIYRWLALLCTCITGGYLGLRYSMREIIRWLSVFGVYILLVSSIFVYVYPDVGIMNYYIIQGAWQGVYWHKNHMGLIASFINLLFLVNLIDAFPARRQSILLWTGLYLYSLVFIYQTDSVAAYLTTLALHGLIAGVLFWLRLRQRIRKIHYTLFVVALLFASAVLYLNLDRFLEIFNRNTTLTGRIPMWSYLFDAFIDQRPIGGYGFNAFWYVRAHQEALQQAAGYPDPIIIADNGFLDILVNTGYIGLSLFLFFYLAVWWRSIQFARKATDLHGFFPLLLMAYTALANLSWSLLFENEGFFLLLMITVLFYMSRKNGLLREPDLTR